jgi:DNA mismatch repair protein MutL
MARRIQVLPDAVANQIAAGEVVERPASVVKELIENALDARATRVEIRLERGGKRRIRVSDDGVGMGREDALLSLDRHATSKIRAADDLTRVRTLGFRGEALPSIAAVSRLRLETREADDDVGTALRANGGTIIGVDDCARQRGTTIDVERLFFNAPVRARFLKSVSVETRAVSEVVVTLALAHPAVAFLLESDGGSLLELPAGRDVAGRIAEVWGDEAASTLIPVSAGAGNVEVRGLIQRPDAAHPGLRRVHLFVNGRPFRAPDLVKAADRGYRTTVPGKARPWLFLYLDVGGEAVDVNVHPAKTEVRFRDTAAVEEAVERAVRIALGGEESAATLDAQLRTPRLAVREGAAPSPEREDGDERDASQMALFLSSDGGPAPETDGEASVESTPRPTRLWQALSMYVIAETRDGLLIIDQHSAHERILFERLMTAFEGEGEESQRLLFPLTVRLTRQEVEQVEALQGLLRRAGFDVEGFGGDTVIVRAVPNPHPWFDAERCFREMVEELTHGSELVRSAGNQHERIAMTFACKGAIKAGQKLGEEEMRELFDRLFATALPFHDVHGRPTAIRLSAGELERKFGRH